MSTLELFNLAIPALFLMFHFAEAAFPAVPYPRSFGWRAAGFGWFVLSGAIVTNLPLLWEGFANRHRVLDLSGLGFWAVPIMLLAGNLLGYWVHRLRHAAPLWRLHQLHHSPERLDVSSAFIFHPLESCLVALEFGVVGVLFGMTAEAGALGGLLGFSCACIQHLNVKTPRWLGYIVQRPESHSVHHERGVHAYNYADLPIVDILFGTFRNPETRSPRIGFFDGGGRRVGRMLLGVDATEPDANGGHATADA